MAYTEILILRHLARTPAHGYELRKRIESTIGISLNNNSLYPALRRFVDAGAVRMTVEQQESRPPRHVYELTDVGREMMHDLLAELPDADAGDDLEFLTRLGQFDLLAPDERLAILDAREKALTAAIEQFERLTERVRVREASEFWSMVVVERLEAQARGERDWLRGLRDEARSRP